MGGLDEEGVKSKCLRGVGRSKEECSDMACGSARAAADVGIYYEDSSRRHARQPEGE